MAAVRERWFGMGMGFVVASSCALRAQGLVTVEAVGPAGIAYTPVAINEVGDVLIEVWTAHEADRDPSDPWFLSEVWRADGEIVRSAGPGGVSFWPKKFSEQGAVLGWTSPPPPGGPVNYWLLQPDGSFVAVLGTRAITNALGLTGDGIVIGNTEESDEWGDNGPLEPFVPMAWTASAGASEIALPVGFSFGSAILPNPDGGYFGFSGDGLIGGQSALTWWDHEGNVETTVDASVLEGSGDRHWAGVRGDGALVGDVDGLVFELSKDGVFRFITDSPQLSLRAVDVNAAGLILGSYVVEEEGFLGHPTVWTPDGTPLDLRAYFAGTGWDVDSVVDITDAGDVLVEGYRPDDPGIRQAFVIHGIPGPGSAALGFMAGLMALWRRRR